MLTVPFSSFPALRYIFFIFICHTELVEVQIKIKKDNAAIGAKIHDFHSFVIPIMYSI
jgi:hypothetical protein